MVEDLLIANKEYFEAMLSEYKRAESKVCREFIENVKSNQIIFSQVGDEDVFYVSGWGTVKKYPEAVASVTIRGMSIVNEDLRNSIYNYCCNLSNEGE